MTNPNIGEIWEYHSINPPNDTIIHVIYIMNKNIYNNIHYIDYDVLVIDSSIVGIGTVEKRIIKSNWVKMV